ncbi:MAG: cysteine--tRNA ligase [Lentisphaeria bacterium]|nr:cysteine--tRNA ligase [Lentisphaeria bacterium]
MALTLYNSLTRRQEPFVPIQPGRVGVYTCGPTVYNMAHIGNFRAYMFEDLLKRTLRFCGYSVTHVMNLTDVDDKTIRDSRAAGISLGDFTARYKKAFFEDVDTLRLLPADEYPAATDHIGDMIALIGALMAKGIAYQADDGSVYFSIARWPAYGQLVKVDPARMRAGERVSLDEYAKESVADFALWKAWSEEDGEVGWDSPWGRGRPGWHIECSAMSSRYLGPHFDIHCGGVDNMFPHHEDEIAQSEAANGCRFVNVWLHCAHLIVDGEKMSKSAGNFHTLRDVLERGYCGRELRYVLLATHYRQQLNFSFQACDDARAALQRLDAFRRRLREATAFADAGTGAAKERSEQALEAFRAALEDDLNISPALAAVFDFVRDGNRLLDEGTVGGPGAAEVLRVLERMDSVLGVMEADAGEGIPAEVEALAGARQAARKARDFARADALRDQLSAMGWTVEDTPKGPRLRRS